MTKLNRKKLFIFTKLFIILLIIPLAVFLLQQSPIKQTKAQNSKTPDLNGDWKVNQEDARQLYSLRGD